MKQKPVVDYVDPEAPPDTQKKHKAATAEISKQISKHIDQAHRLSYVTSEALYERDDRANELRHLVQHIQAKPVDPDNTDSWKAWHANLNKLVECMIGRSNWEQIANNCEHHLLPDTDDPDFPPATQKQTWSARTRQRSSG
ncbi:MAG: hypothetical protein COB29_14360 [Sulfitobacter sp.]|nr:MAG: hypothetical protein COB29_14360 [Sulfitobacter sp.]